MVDFTLPSFSGQMFLLYPTFFVIALYLSSPLFLSSHFLFKLFVLIYPNACLFLFPPHIYSPPVLLYNAFLLFHYAVLFSCHTLLTIIIFQYLNDTSVCAYQRRETMGNSDRPSSFFPRLII